MIEGVKVSVSGKELKAHLEARSLYHKEQADAYSKRRTAMSSLQEERNVSGDPVGMFRAEEKAHSQKAQMFAFLAGHIDPDETFRITGYELVLLEFTETFL